MEVVEEVVTGTPDVEPVQEVQPPGSLTKNPRANRRPKLDQALSGGDSADWNKFARDLSPKKQAAQISSYSKEEAVRRKQREKERREVLDRNAKIVLQRAEVEASRQQQEKEQKQAERKAWAQAKFEQRQQKILRAAEERQKREVAYNSFIEKTREKGLLFEKLQAQGQEMVASAERRKVEEYKTLVAPAKKVTARDMQHSDDLHPSLRALQRVQQQNNIRREAAKLPSAFSPKHVHTGPGGVSPFSSAIGERRMPGTGMSRPGSTRDPSPQSRPVTKLRRPSPVRNCCPSVDRASSPVAIPGVEITVHELPKISQTDVRHSVRTNSLRQHAEPAQDQGDMHTVEVAAAEVPETVPEQEEPVPVAAARGEEESDESSPEEHNSTGVDEARLEAAQDATVEDEVAAPEVAEDTPGDLEEEVSSPEETPEPHPVQDEEPGADTGEVEDAEL